MATVVCLTFVAIAATIPSQLIVIRIIAAFVGLFLSVLATFRTSLLLTRITLLAEVGLFSMSLVAALFSPAIASVFPLLLLTFVMILFSDRTLHLYASQGVEFSTSIDRLLDFNAPVIERSLTHLFRRLARNGVMFAGCYLLTVMVLLGGFDLSRVAPILSDASLYILIISISLALLVSMKED
jgi:hypothetical protein